MKRLLPALILLVVVGGAWWYDSAQSRADRKAWRPLPGGGEVRLLTVTHGHVHRYQGPGPTLRERINQAARTRSLAPLRQPEVGDDRDVLPQPDAGLGLWLEMRGRPEVPMPKDPAVVLPGGSTLSSDVGTTQDGFNGCLRSIQFIHYIPNRSRTFRYVCILDDQRFEFDCENPAFRADLPVWQGTPLPQTQPGGEYAMTLRELKIKRELAPFSSNEWCLAKPVWTMTRNGMDVSKWFETETRYEDPSGQALRNCGLFEEPVWKVRFKVSRTNAYPFRDDQVDWFGATGPDAPSAQTAQLFTIDAASGKRGIKLGGVFGPGQYWYRDGAIVKTGTLAEIDPQSSRTIAFDEQGLHLTLESPAIVLFGHAFLVCRDAAGRPITLDDLASFVFGENRIAVYGFPKSPVRIGTADTTEPSAETFDFLIRAPALPALTPRKN